MKFKLILSYEIPRDDDNYDILAEDDSYYNQATNSDLPPRRNNVSLDRKIHRVLSKISKSEMELYFNNIMVDIPDEIMFQFLMDGLKENDFICYNIYNKKIVFSNDPYDAYTASNFNCDYKELCNNSTWARGYQVNKGSSDYLMLDWRLKTRKTEFRDEEKHTIEVIGNPFGVFYNDIKNVIIDIIENEIYNKFMYFTKMIPITLRNIKIPVIDDDYGRASHYKSEDPDEFNEGMQLSINQLSFMVNSYLNDDEYWKKVEKILSEVEINYIQSLIFYAEERDN